MTAEDYEPEDTLLGGGGRLRLLELQPDPNGLPDYLSVGPNPAGMGFPADGAGRAPVRHLAGECDHFVQFYETDAFLVDSLSGFFGPAIVAAEAAIIIATPEHREALESRLVASGVDVPAATAAGRYVPLDAADTITMFMVEGSPDRHRFFELVGGVISRAGEGGRAVRAFGEVVALLCAEGNYSGAIALESLWNELRANACVYFAVRLPNAHL
jgi:MEDS: MEthanogen/methylotroph, DcmR Sensory domain